MGKGSIPHWKPPGITALEGTRFSHSHLSIIQYTKENASAELTWRPLRWVNLGAMYAWERYDRDRRSVDVTNENSVKVYADVNPWDWMRARASLLYGQRRYDNYNESLFEEVPRGILSEGQLVQMRKFDVADRNRTKSEASVEITPWSFLTVTPNFGLRYDDFPDTIANQLGVSQDRSWNAGVEVGVTPHPVVRFLVAYNYETRTLRLADCCGNTAAAVLADIPGNTWRSDIDQRFHTFMAAVDLKANPNRLEFRFEYLQARSLESNATFNCLTGNSACVTDPQFPDEKNRFQRFNAVAKYIIDPEFVRRMGLAGEAVFKLRYTWERNHNANWAIDQLTPYIATPDTVDLTGGNRSFFMAAINPRYDAHIGVASLQLRW